MDAIDKLIPKEIVLKPFKFYDVTRFSANAIKRVEQDGMCVLRVCDSDEIEVRFRLLVSATEPQRVSASWPDTWWDAVKARWFPRWALRRWPALMRTVSMERAGLYPEIPWKGGSLMAIPYLNEYRGGYADRGGDDG